MPLITGKEEIYRSAAELRSAMHSHGFLTMGVFDLSDEKHSILYASLGIESIALVQVKLVPEQVTYSPQEANNIN